MTPTVQEIINIIEEIAPESLAENWDNVGLLAGDPQQKVKKILLALDPTTDIIEQAIRQQCNLLITHHPIIFRPLHAIEFQSPTGFFITRALQHNIAIIGCHTNLDAASGGVSDVLANAIGLHNIHPLMASSTTQDEHIGLGRVGSFSIPVTTEDFINTIITTLDPPWLLEAGPRPEAVAKVAVCGGSCGDFAQLALTLGVDVLVTSEIKHDVARWAEDSNFWIIDGGHFATENPAIPLFQNYLQKASENKKYSVEIVLGQQQPPLKLIRESIK